MDVDRLELGEARRFAVASMLMPAAFLVFEVLGLVAFLTEDDRAFIAVAGWGLGAMAPLSLYQIHILATLSEVTTAPSFVDVWVLGPWKLSLGAIGRRLHRRAELGPRSWSLQVGLWILAALGVVIPVNLIVAVEWLLATTAR